MSESQARAQSQPIWRRLLDRYLEGLELERGLAPNTVEAYRRDLERFATFLAKRTKHDLLSAKQKDLSLHLRSLRLAGLSPRSIGRALVSLRRFFEHLSAEGERRPSARRLVQSA